MEVQKFKVSPNDCIACPTGRYNDEPGAPECKSCEFGKYTQDAVNCIECDVGKYAKTITPFTYFELQRAGYL